MAKRNSIRQTQIFHDYYSRLRAIALSRFKFNGFPDTCNMRFLNKCLYEDGKAIFVDDPEMRILNLRVTPVGDLNVYNESLHYQAYSTGYSKIFHKDDCVIFRNNELMKSTDSTLILYAEKLADLDMAISVNIRSQKTPVLVRCDKKTQFSLEKVYDQFDGNRPVIFGSKTLQEKPLEVLRTDSPFVADRLRDEKRAIWNEAFEFLGYNTNPSDKKKERVITVEVESNNEQVDSQLNATLKCLQEGCEEFNEKFGYKTSVEMCELPHDKRSEIIDGNTYD